MKNCSKGWRERPSRSEERGESPSMTPPRTQVEGAKPTSEGAFVDRDGRRGGVCRVQDRVLG